ncbi:LOW QUALITY PROTEIN: cathepsin d [Plakobranchus ocellatus]|uniref:Cathepsin d n=1 Tax=Plakobranchus ocellatus TaxID=259542 RepID=A0AAV4BNB4_9GAST|nr:LOW QUALITY PROTEIN: cathepsin d [Plakobranchus ocellatus]
MNCSAQRIWSIYSFPVNAASRPRTHFHRQPQQRLHAPVRLRALSRQDGNRKLVTAQASTIDIELQNLNNTIYYGPISFGTPGQRLNVIFDTSASVIWILSKLCLTNQECRMRRTYNNMLSTTFKNKRVKFAYEYFTGSVSGIYAEDNVSVGAFSVENQTFGLAKINLGVYDNVGIDGMIGLGFHNIYGSEEPNLLDNMLRQGILQNPVFSFYLNRKNSGDRSSRLTLGGTNPDLYTGDFTFAPLSAPNQWQFKGDRIQINSGRVIFCENGFQGVVQSDKDMIAGPIEDVTDLNKRLGAKPVFDNGYLSVFEIPCDSVNSLPDVEFIVNGKKLALTSEDYVVKTDVAVTVRYPPTSWTDNVRNKTGLVVGAATVSRIMRGHIMAPLFPLSNRANDVRPGCKTQRIAPTLRQVAALVCARTKEKSISKHVVLVT